jgi:regulatory protein
VITQLTVNQIVVKARHYCAYQERCTFELKNKLKELKVQPHLISDIISQLKEENFIDDERFCKLYARSKFKHSKWGKLKIQLALRQKMLPENLIEIGLAEIPDEDYKNLVVDLYQAKVKNKNIDYEEKQKAMQYLASKGFEKELILTCINTR